jgi:hypothetical protein
MIIEIAVEYIISILLEDKTVKTFPKEFVDESVKWAKSWLLTSDDSIINAKLEDPNRSIDVKKYIIQGKLEGLNNNPQFAKELTERLASFEQQRERLKNVVTDADIDVKGVVYIGYKGGSLGDNYDEKNIIKGSMIKAGGGFRLGDDVISGIQNVHIVHNYFGDGKGHQYADVKSELKTLLRKEKTDEVIERLLDHTESNDNDAHNTVLLLSARLNRINSQEHKGIISNGEAGIERNKINAALASLIEDLTIE